MLQYSDGFVSINGNNKTELTGFDTLFMQNAKKGDLIVFDPELSVVYTIQKVNSNTSITLSSNYAGNFLNKKIKYSITRLFSSLFDLPVTQYMDKGFSSIVTLKLRMLDVLMKNLGFRHPDEPVCTSGIIGIIQPDEVNDFGAKWYINGNESNLYNSNYLKILNPGQYVLSLINIPGYGRLTDKTVQLYNSETKKVYLRYLKIADPDQIVEPLIIYAPEIISIAKRIPKPILLVVFENGDEYSIPPQKYVRYRETTSFYITASYIINQSIIDDPLNNLFESNINLASFTSNTLTTDIVKNDGLIRLKAKTFGKVKDKCTINNCEFLSIRKNEKIEKVITKKEELSFLFNYQSIRKRDVIKINTIKEEKTSLSFEFLSMRKSDKIIIP